MIHSMNLFEQFRAAEEQISQGGNDFTLFGLFQRDDLPSKYDLVVSASWLMGDRSSMNLLVELVRQAIGNDNWWPRIGKFVVLPQDDPFVQAVLSRMPDDAARHQLKVINDLPYEDEIISNAVIITAVKPMVGGRIPERVAA